LEVVKLLLQNEAIDVNMVTKPQELSALKLACSNGYYEIAELLVQ
jgi:predicted DNA binding protein